MKYMNKTLLFGACLLGAAALPAQVLVDDFEASTNTWVTESCYSDIRENEYKTGLNLSDKVLYAQRSPGCNNWSGAIFRPATPYTGYNYLHVLMYRNNAAQPNLKVSDEHPTGGTLDLTPMTTIHAGEWQDVVFDISAFATAGVDFIMLMVDRTEPLEADAWMLCDHIELSNDPTPRTTPVGGGDDEPQTPPTPSEGEEGTGETDGYRLVWADYFNEGTLDRDNWNIEVNGDGGGNDELQYYTDRTENVSVGIEPATGKGCLIITARREDYQGRTCTSGRLTTQDKVYFTHGKVEASIKFPHTADGLWPAFWMMGNSYSEVGWPRCSETDIVEMGHVTGIQNGTQDRYFNGAYHWGFYNDQGQYPNTANHYTAGYSLQDDFHLFTVYWDESSIRMYLDQDRYPDAQPYSQLDITDASGEWSTGNYFHQPNFILLNMAVGGRFPNIFNIDQVTALASGQASMYVDFVKVYQRGTADETFQGPATSSAADLLHDAAQMSVYPNPAVDYVRFGRTVQRVEALNMQGGVVAVASEADGLDVSGWMPGMYLLRLTGDGQRECVKLVVK